MRDIVSFVTTTLSGIGVPVVFQGFSPGTTLPAQYITFLEYHTGPELEAADEEITTERLIQFNVWSKSNYHALCEKLRKALEKEGFERTFEFDSPHEDGDSHFNKVMRFKFVDEY